MAKYGDIQIQIKQINDLPPHITYKQYKQLLQAVDMKYSERRYGKKTGYYRDRDKLFLMLLWETGGRVSDVCNIRVSDFDFVNKNLRLYMKKTKRAIVIPMLPETLLVCSEYIRQHGITDRLFNFNRITAWKKVVEYGRMVGIEKIHPHMFRHGLAIHLLENHVPIPVISARLGHSSTKTTIDSYLVITPEIQRQFVSSALRSE